MEPLLTSEDFINQLETQVEDKWKTIIQTSPLTQSILKGESTKELLETFLIETVHYTSHNAKNQALAGTKIELMNPTLIGYMKFCFHHAEEEVGHEFMALHDLNSLGNTYTIAQLPPPLKATQTFIDYIYEVANGPNVFARLGYSFWAENSYKHFGSVIEAIMRTLRLSPTQMTFFISHGEIDSHHSQEIFSIINKYIHTAADQRAIADVAMKSLDLTQAMINGIWEKYQSNRRSVTV